MQADVARICSVEAGKHGDRTTEMNHAAGVGGNMLAVAGASVEMVAEFVVSPTVPLR